MRRINKGERRADPDERHKIPDADVHAGAMQSGQNNDVHVDELHEDDPAGDQAKLVRMFLDRTQ